MLLQVLKYKMNNTYKTTAYTTLPHHVFTHQMMTVWYVRLYILDQKQQLPRCLVIVSSLCFKQQKYLLAIQTRLMLVMNCFTRNPLSAFIQRKCFRPLFIILGCHMMYFYITEKDLTSALFQWSWEKTHVKEVVSSNSST